MSDASSKGDEAVDTYDDAFLKKIEMGMLSQISLQVCQSLFFLLINKCISVNQATIAVIVCDVKE